MARIVVLFVVASLCAACAAAAPSAATSQPGATDQRAAQQAEVAWRHLATVEGTLAGQAAAAAVESQRDLAAAWQRHELPGGVPEIDFERSFVLLLGQPDDACVDELIGLKVSDGRLRAQWLPPPGGCAQPLVFRIHAVEVDRRHVPAQFDVAFAPPYERDAKAVTIDVATVDGEAPAEPEPPAAMSDSDIDAVFEGHAVRRCTSDDNRLGERPVDGPLSDDPAVAEAQKQRANFGVASDEATTRRVMDSKDRNDEYGFPLLDAELQQDFRAGEKSEEVRRWLRNQGYRPNVDFVAFISRRDGIRPGVWVDGGQAPQVRRQLDEAFGDGAVLVEDNGYDFQAIDAAQRKLGSIMGGSGPGSIVSSTGIPGPVELGMIDPTREALDRVADTVDPALVCVAPDLAGVPVARPAR